MWTYNTLIVVIGSALLGAISGTIGCFAILRRRALLGDVIAHSAFPGIALAFWITQSKSLPILLVGALTSSLFGVWTLSYIRQKTRTKEDAAMALVLSVFFGSGVSLSRYVQNTVTEASQAGLDTYILGKTAGIVLNDIYLLIGVSIVVLTYVIFAIKEFRLITFDPQYANTIGWNAAWIDFSIMSLIALTVIIGLPMVGIVMMAAMVLIPAVAARFWTNNFTVMLSLAAIIGVISACTGVLISSSVSMMPTGPTIILCAGTLFLFSAFLAPEKGVLSYWFRHLQFQLDWGIRCLILQLVKKESLSKEEGLIILKNMGFSYSKLIIIRALKKGRFQYKNGSLFLTRQGIQWYEQEANKL